MMAFRKLSAESIGKLLAAYFTQNTPDPIHDFAKDAGKVLDSGERLTSYYTGRDSRATWRPDMSDEVAKALGIDRLQMPKTDELARLFEAKRGDTGEGWSEHKRGISAYDLTLAPHKSISLAAEFASTAAESAMLWHAIDRANDQTMRYVADELGWARKGHGGEDGAEPGQVGWVSFRHHTARPTLQVRDGKEGATYLVDSPVGGDPHAHIHNALFNMVVTDNGRIGSLDTQRLHSRVHEFGAYFQARLADELRRIGARISYDKNEQAVVLDAIPEAASELFSSRTADVTRAAKRYADENAHDWDGMSIEQKNKMIKMSSLATRLRKSDAGNDKASWKERAEAIGWAHKTVLKEAEHAPLADVDRFDRAYDFAARNLAKEFHTAAVVDHDKLRLLATRGLIGVGISGGPKDIDRVVALIEQRGIEVRGEHVALILGMSGDKIRVTHTAQVRIEESLAAEARRAALDKSGALSEEAIRKAIATSGLDLSGEHGKAQSAAIYAMGKGGGLSLLTGVAGAGKTTLLQPLVSAWKADTRFDAGGRDVVGVATAWRQADALRDAGIGVTQAMTPFLGMVEKGEFQPTRNTVLVIDEISQVAPRHMLKLLELQRDTGMTIKVLGDREQAQSIEAGDVIEIMRRMLPKEDMPELLSTVRQATQRNREIAGLFRGQEPEMDDLAAIGSKQRGRKIQERNLSPGRADADDEFALRQTFHFGEVQQALRMKREDGTARLVGGDHDEVLAEIADFYMGRRDALRASGAKKGITMSALTNQDAADLSQAVRVRMKARGELGNDERMVPAVDQRGEQYEMAIATGDKVRLYRRTFGIVDGKKGYIGNNGDIVEVLGFTDKGLRLKGDKGRIAEIDWRQFNDQKTGRSLIGFGHAMTIDAAQGMTSDEHINALPRGVGSMTGFTAYVAESRARGTSWTMVADGATFEAVRNKRAIGDLAPVKVEDLWDHVANSMASKPYKALGMDLAALVREDRSRATETLMRAGHLAETMQSEGRNLGREIRLRLQAEAVRQYIPKHIAALDAAIARSATARPRMSPAELHLRTVRVDAEDARRSLAKIVSRRPDSAPAP